MHTLLCVKWIASGKWLYSTGCSVQCSVMPRGVGWGWVGGLEGGLKGRGYMYTYS